MEVTTAPARRRERGATMIEILVTIVIIAFGLLGIAGLQVRMQMSEMEAYQRSQALLLANDIANRMSTNRAAVKTDQYLTGTDTPLGTAYDCGDIDASTRVGADLAAWCNALQGAAELATVGGVSTSRGAMIGGRGCIEKAPDGDYLITVAWQGLTPISAPPDSLACGAGAFNTVNTPCVNDLCRRTVTTLVRIGTLL